MTTIEIPDDVEQLLSIEARKEGVSLTEIAKEALRSFIEDRHDYNQGIETLARIKSGSEKTISLDALQHELRD